MEFFFSNQRRKKMSQEKDSSSRFTQMSFRNFCHCKYTGAYNKNAKITVCTNCSLNFSIGLSQLAPLDKFKL